MNLLLVVIGMLGSVFFMCRTAAHVMQYIVLNDGKVYSRMKRTLIWDVVLWNAFGLLVFISTFI